MVRSSAAAFYRLPDCVFYSFTSCGRGDRFTFRLLLRVHSELKEIIHRMAEILLAVQWEAVDWLERLGTSDMVPALTELAQSVPSQGATKGDVAVRKNAAKAIVAIQRRASEQ